MTLKEWAAGEKKLVDNFVHWWEENQMLQDEKSERPTEMEPGDWDDQFRLFTT